MDARFAWTTVAIGAVTLCAVLATNLPQRGETLPMAEPVSDVELPAPPKQAPTESQQPQEPEHLYILREYNGLIGVFLPGEEEPQQVLDVPVKFLPDYDQAMMAEGIRVNSYQELTALIEDYIS